MQLKRRHDLIPNLVQVGEGRHGLRAGDAHRGRPGAQRGGRRQSATLRRQDRPRQLLTQATRGLFALVESYPQLKANDNIKQLQEELTDDREQDRLLAPVLQRLGQRL